MSILRPFTACDDPETTYGFTFWCPGCEDLHQVRIKTDSGCVKDPVWGFNGNVEAPTFTPSVRVRYGGEEPRVCHFFVKAGKIEFLNDCTHALAGQTVDMVEDPNDG